MSWSMYTSPPNGESPDINMFGNTGDDLDDGTFSMGVDNPTFDPNDFLNADLMASPQPANAAVNFGSPALTTFPSQHHQPKNDVNHMASFKPRSVVSSASPESSTQDSSSDSSGRRKRKSPSEASPAATYGSFPSHQPGQALEMARGKRRPKIDSPVFKKEDESMGMLNNSMGQSFNLKSAGNSPPGMLPNLQTAATWDVGTPRSLATNDFSSMPVRTRTPATFQFGGNSRDNTPPSAMSFDSPQNTGFMMMRDSPDTDGLGYAGNTPQFANFDTNAFSMFSPAPAPAIMTTTNMPTVRPGDVNRAQLRLHVSPLGHKSRVETQIPVKLTLDPCPPHIKKVHLPTETIAKAKFLAKDAALSPDTLELSAMLVCTSAMEKRENKAHALQIARDGTHLKRGTNPRRSSTGDAKKGGEMDPNDPDAPMNGGPVRICDNCVSRERKRAGRKKAKKQEDEERWHEYEHDRIIMFNTTEYQDLHPPGAAKEPQYAENVTFGPEAKQIDAPMRIVCYCRHQQEKIGFQVIFTLKDWQGNVVAQQVTQSILITDDHKTHTHGAPSQSGLAVAENPQITVPSFIGAGSAVQHHGLPGRAYHSSTNLAGLGNQNYWNNLSNAMAQGQRSTTSMTPRNLSRPASPSGHVGPKKKRKGSSGQHKIPADLMMTRSDLEPVSVPQSAIAGPSSAMGGLVSPDQANFGFNDPIVGAFSGMPQQSTFNTTPPTPEASIAQTKSREQADYSYYSVPNSAHASRAASPTSFARQQMGAMYHPQSATAGAAFTGIPFNAAEASQPAAPANVPSIMKVRPDRGPVTGNVEIVILGKNFSRDLEVRFGDNIATTTTFWNSDTLVCLLPPALQPGNVPVTFVSTGQRGYSPQNTSATMFTYVDDTRQQLFELALQLQCSAQLGPGADPYEFARSILAASNAAGYGGGQGGAFAGNMLNAGNTEQILMAILNKVDLIDSPYKPYYDHRTEGGSTMLALACRLGYEQLVAGLLARGADFDKRDKSGFTPLMLAARAGFIPIVRRLILRGADPTLRCKIGATAAELASSVEVRHYVRHRRHYRSVSAGTPYLRSRANSEVSTRSLWGPPSSNASSTMYSTEDDDDSAIVEDGISDEDEEDEQPDILAPIPISALASRRQSLAAAAAVLQHSRRGSELASLPSLPLQQPTTPNTAAASTIAVFSAWRDQLTQQINALQQNLGNMQISDLLHEQNMTLPALSRRFSQLMPLRGMGTPRPLEEGERVGSPASSDADAPPPYHEACPDGVGNDFDTKPSEVFAPLRHTMAQAESSHVPTTSSSLLNPIIGNVPPSAMRERLARQSAKAHAMDNQAQKVLPPVLRLGLTNPTAEEAKQLRKLREEGLTRARNDRNLWFIWFPLLIVLVLWYLFGFGSRAPMTLGSWIKALGESVVEVVGGAVPVLGRVGDRAGVDVGVAV